MKLPGSIRFRLSLWYSLFLLTILGIFATFSYVMLSQNVYHWLSEPLKISSIIYDASPDNATDSINRLNSDQEYTHFYTYTLTHDQITDIQAKDVYLHVIDTDKGQIVIDLKKVIPSDMQGDLELWFYRRPATNNVTNYEITAISQSKTSSVNVMQAYSQVLIILFPVTIVLAGLMVYFLAKMILKPVEDIAKVAKRMGENDLDSRISVQNDDELGMLSKTLNQTFGRLQNEFEKERQFIADASHGLRAPLSIIQGEAKLALNKARKNTEYRRSLELISQDIDRMSSLIHKLLVLSRVDYNGEQVNFVNINLQQLLDDIALDVQVICNEKHIDLQLDLKPSITIEGDVLKLRELFINLLDNAVRYTSEGGKIMVSLNCNENMATVGIKDTGIGIPPEHIPHVMERFYRVDKSFKYGEGTGLGLAICEQITELHGGSIAVESEVGVGSLFSVTLPIT